MNKLGTASDMSNLNRSAQECHTWCKGLAGQAEKSIGCVLLYLVFPHCGRRKASVKPCRSSRRLPVAVHFIFTSHMQYLDFPCATVIVLSSFQFHEVFLDQLSESSNYDATQILFLSLELKIATGAGLFPHHFW